jgi:hypothetical protein
MRFLCASRREISREDCEFQLDLRNLRHVLDFIDGEGDHCWERLRRIDGGDLRRAG